MQVFGPKLLPMGFGGFMKKLMACALFLMLMGQLSCSSASSSSDPSQKSPMCGGYDHSGTTTSVQPNSNSNNNSLNCPSGQHESGGACVSN